MVISKLSVVAVLVLALAGVSSAAEYSWDNGIGTDEVTWSPGYLVSMNVFYTASPSNLIDQLKVAWGNLSVGDNVRVILYGITNGQNLPYWGTPTCLTILREVDTTLTSDQINNGFVYDGAGTGQISPPVTNPIWTTYNIPPTLVTTTRFAVATIAYDSDQNTIGTTLLDHATNVNSATYGDISWIGCSSPMSSDLHDINGSFNSILGFASYGYQNNPYLIRAAGSHGTTTLTWDAGGAADTNWATATNWTTDTAPSTVPEYDDVVFNSNTANSKTITLTSGTTNVNSVLVTGWNPIFTFANAGAALNVAGNFTTNGGWGWDTTTVAPVVTIGGQLSSTYAPSVAWAAGRLKFNANGNTVGGGINAEFTGFNFAGNNNVIGSGITVQGFSANDWVSGIGGGNGTTGNNGYCAGNVLFTGTGNVISGAMNLGRYGSLVFGAKPFTATADLTGVTAFNFNGGALVFEGIGTSTVPAFTLPGSLTNFNVASGTLWLSPYAIGSTPTITLGGLGDYGMLAGFSYKTNATNDGWVDVPLPNSLVLAGNGGWVRCNYNQNDPGAAYADGGHWVFNDISGSISGTGQLVKIGNANTTLSGTNSYQGGTLVAAGSLYVTSASSLGTGSVKIFSAQAALGLGGSGNLGTGATVLVPKSGTGPCGVLYSGVLMMQTNTFMPALDPTSDGILQLNATNATGGSALGTALAAAPPGNGKMFLGGQNWASYSAATLAPGLPDTTGGDYVYRFSSNATNQEAQLLVQATCHLADMTNPDLSVTPSDVLVYNGGGVVYGDSTFSGTLTVRNTLGTSTAVWGANNIPIGFLGITSATGSAFGASTGNVVLLDGVLGVQPAASTAVAAVKNGLSISGNNLVQLNSLTAPGYLTEIDFAALTRNNRGTLMIRPVVNGATDNGLGVGGMDKIKLGNVANDAHGMVPAYIVAANLYNTGDFLTNDPTDGLTKVPFVVMPTSGGTGAEIAQAGDTALTGDVSVWALRMDGNVTGNGHTITLGSGGLILTSSVNAARGVDTGNPVVNSANFEAGDGTAEMLIFGNGTNVNWNKAITLSGTIAAGGLTCFGGGLVRLDGTVNNTSTLVGDIYINGGRFGVCGTADTTAADRAMGAASNKIVINGGQFYVPNVGYNVTNDHQIKVGPAGGSIGGDYNGSLIEYGAISDLDPANPGVLYWSNNTNMVWSDNSGFSGTSVFTGGGTRFGGTSTPGTGPIVIDYNGNLSVYLHTGVMDCSTSALTIVNQGMLALDTAGAKFGSLAGSGNVRWGNEWDGTSDMTLTVGYNNTSTDWSGQMYENEARTGIFTKVGAGTMTVWSDVNWHGATTVNGGTLRFNGYFGGGVKAGAPITVNATGTLDGNGTVERDVTVNTGGTVTGGLIVKGNLTVAGGGAGGNLTINGWANVTSGSFSSNGPVAGLFTTAGTVTGNARFNSGVAMTGGSFAGTHTITGAVDVEGGSFGGTNTITGNVTVAQTSVLGSVVGDSTITGNVDVYTGGSLAGAHNITGNLATHGPTILNPSDTPGAVQKLTVVGDVSLDAGTLLNYKLTTPGLDTGGGVNDFIDINGSGNLILDGTLNILGSAPFNHGTYRLMNYTGTLTDNGLVIGTTPDSGLQYTISAGGGHVDLTATALYAPGDVNRDGVVNSLDIDDIYHHFGAVPPNGQWDVNADGVVNQLDVTYEVTSTAVGLKTEYGDANLDHKVNFSDFQVLLDHWQATGGAWATGDFTGDTVVNFGDFQKLLDYWNPAGYGSSVPEPTTLVLLALGALGLIRRRR